MKSDAGAYHEFPPGGRLGGPVIRFDAIREGWGLLQDQWVTWVFTSACVLAANFCIAVVWAELSGGWRPPGVGGFRAPFPSAMMTFGRLLHAGVNGLLLGGMFRMACLQVRGREVRVSDLLGVQDVLFELCVGSVLYALACILGASVLVVPGLIAFGVLMFTFPLIVDGRLTALAALRGSFLALKGEWLAATVFHITLYVLAGLGACFCLVGLLLTMPLYCLSIAVLYRDAFLGKKGGKPAGPLPADPYF